MIDKIQNKLIVSCQALEDEPLHGSHIMAKMALAAKIGGAVAIRANSVEDIKAIKKETGLPIIGLIKKGYADSEVFITPTKDEVLDLINCDCEMIAIDATKRKRPTNDSLKDLVDLIHQNNKLALADISTIEEARYAEEIGFDAVSTTLSGYTSYSPKKEEPDYKLVKECVKRLNIPVIAEGRIKTLKQLKKMLKCNPHSIVIGSAITRPQIITNYFMQAYK